ncbi:hypothetical protein D0Y65_038616 [Glycine soja]|uniref:UBN2 domain-containing protein n=2 Tax=Glycine subgen. Soja TaxID=1462606 RepID=A0A0R0GPP3_SOYBN|nr:hypothetical protein D0Y65_038616 [Glycine soja]
MWDTLAITYEGSFEVKHNKLSLLTRKNSLVDIQTMFERFKTILNELGSLTLRAIKNIDSMTLEELVRILKLHEQELSQDEGSKKGNSLALTSKALVVNDVSKEESDDDESNEETKRYLVDEILRIFKTWKKG